MFSSVLLNDFGEIDEEVDLMSYMHMADEDQIRKQFWI